MAGKNFFVDKSLFYKGKDGRDYATYEQLEDANKRYFDTYFPKICVSKNQMPRKPVDSTVLLKRALSVLGITESALEVEVLIRELEAIEQLKQEATDNFSNENAGRLYKCLGDTDEFWELVNQGIENRDN